MSKDPTALMPKEIARAFNLMVHPAAGAAAMSALSLGIASQMVGAWMGVVSGAVEASQRLLSQVEPASKDFETMAEATAARARTATVIKLTDAVKAPKKAAAPDIAETPAVPVAAAVSAVANFAKPRSMTKPAVPDDLKRISGVGPKLEKVLNGLGVWSFAQIAGWRFEEIAWVDDFLSFAGRIERDGWIEQAKSLAGNAKS